VLEGVQDAAYDAVQYGMHWALQRKQHDGFEAYISSTMDLKHMFVCKLIILWRFVW